MRKTYKEIPKVLRKEYSKNIRKQLFKAVKAFFLFPKLYRNREQLYNMGVVGDNLHIADNHLYWYVDNSEVDFVSCWWGDEAYRIRKGFDYNTASKFKKFLWSFNWVVIRNSVWNFKTLSGLQFKKGFITDKILQHVGDAPVTKWRNQTIHGEQSVILKSRSTDQLFFRYSYTLPLKKLSPLRLFGFKYRNRMRGVENRYIYKNRLVK